MPKKNTLEDLRDHLFQSLEDLDNIDDDGNVMLSEEALKKAEAVSKIGKVLVDSAKVEMQFMKMKYGKNVDSVQNNFIEGHESKNKKPEVPGISSNSSSNEE